MIQIDLSANTRDRFGKGAARSLRREGKTPAVLYGPKIEAMALDLDSRDFTKSLLMLQRRNAVVNLTIEAEDGKSEVRYALIKEVQTDPVRNTLVHADFMEVSKEETMTFEVPIQMDGNAKGVELGGELHTPMTTVTLRGTVLDIPDFIAVDVSDMDIGDKVFCKDLDIPSDMTMLDKDEQVCISVTVASKVVEEEEFGEEEEGEAAAADTEESEESAE